MGRHVLRVRGRDASGKTETSDFTLHVSAANDAPEAEASIKGSLEEGRVVHFRVVGLSDEDGVPSSSRSHRYRWCESSEPEVHSSWSSIAGAESASFGAGRGCPLQEFSCFGGSDIRRGGEHRFFEGVFRRDGTSGFSQFGARTREDFVDETYAQQWHSIPHASAVSVSSGEEAVKKFDSDGEVSRDFGEEVRQATENVGAEERLQLAEYVLRRKALLHVMGSLIRRTKKPLRARRNITSSGRCIDSSARCRCEEA